MLDFEQGQPLIVSVSTNNGKETYKGEFVSSDETELVLNENPHTPFEGWVFIPRENIVAIHKNTPLALALATFIFPRLE